MGEGDGVVVVPRALADEVAAEAPEQERLERFVQLKVKEGAGVVGLYPPSEETVEEYQRWLEAGDQQGGLRGRREGPPRRPNPPMRAAPRHHLPGLLRHPELRAADHHHRGVDRRDVRALHLGPRRRRRAAAVGGRAGGVSGRRTGLTGAAMLSSRGRWCRVRIVRPGSAPLTVSARPGPVARGAMDVQGGYGS